MITICGINNSADGQVNVELMNAWICVRMWGCVVCLWANRFLDCRTHSINPNHLIYPKQTQTIICDTHTLEWQQRRTTMYSSEGWNVYIYIYIYVLFRTASSSSLQHILNVNTIIFLCHTKACATHPHLHTLFSRFNWKSAPKTYRWHWPKIVPYAQDQTESPNPIRRQSTDDWRHERASFRTIGAFLAINRPPARNAPNWPDHHGILMDAKYMLQQSNPNVKASIHHCNHATEPRQPHSEDIAKMFAQITRKFNFYLFTLALSQSEQRALLQH